MVATGYIFTDCKSTICFLKAKVGAQGAVMLAALTEAVSSLHAVYLTVSRDPMLLASSGPCTYMHTDRHTETHQIIFKMNGRVQVYADR